MWRAVVGLVVFALVLVSGEAAHCDWQGCIEGATERRIAACTAFIEAGNRNHDQFKAAHLIRASLYLAKRDFDLALVDANTAIQLDPDKAAPYSMRGSIHYGLGEMDQAIEDFNQAIRRDPKFIPAYSNRAHAYLAIGERELAVADLKKVLELPASVKQWEGLQTLALSSVQKLTSTKELNPDPDPALNEAIVKVPLSLKLPTGAQHRGEFALTTFKPKGPGPFPTVIVSHGHSGVLRTAFGRNRMLWSYFVQRGFAVLAPTRIGHGVSSTPVDPEVPQLPAGVVPTGPDGRCDSWDFRPASEAGVAHILATIQYAATLPWVAIDDIVLVGASAGGFYSLVAAGTAPRGVRGVVNFVGGLGGLPTRPGRPCNPNNVKALLAEAGRNNSIPTIWLYAENDANFGAAVPREWLDAYVAAGGRAEFHMLPPLGDDGHNIIGPGTKHWLPLVDEFLMANGFKPRQLPPDAPQPSQFAPLEDTARVPLINDKGRAAYATFLTKPVLRAFAIGPDGFWAYSAGKYDALADALARCEQAGERSCKLYAVNDEVVW